MVGGFEYRKDPIDEPRETFPDGRNSEAEMARRTALHKKQLKISKRKETDESERDTMRLKTLGPLVKVSREPDWGHEIPPIGHSGDEHDHLLKGPDGPLPSRDGKTLHSENAAWQPPNPRLSGIEENETD